MQYADKECVSPIVLLLFLLTLRARDEEMVEVASGGVPLSRIGQMGNDTSKIVLHWQASI